MQLQLKKLVKINTFLLIYWFHNRPINQYKNAVNSFTFHASNHYKNQNIIHDFQSEIKWTSSRFKNNTNLYILLWSVDNMSMWKTVTETSASDYYLLYA